MSVDREPDPPKDGPAMQAQLGLIDRSAEDIRRGRTRPMRQALREVAEELGIELNR